MIKIMTDTASDITRTQAAQMNVELVPINVTFKGVHYDQMADETFEAFFTLLAQEKELPTTSQPSPTDFLPVFEQAKQDGDAVIAILLSGGLSGTVQSALIAKEMADYDQIYVIDSRQAVIGMRLLVDYALKMRADGKSAAEIAAVLEDAIPRIRLFAGLETLKYLRKGGRIPKSAELIGNALGIKPLIKLIDGKGTLEMAGKARGNAGVVTNLIRHMEENASFDPAMPVYFGYTQTDVACRNFRKLAIPRFQLKDSQAYPVGPIIGTHVGPGVAAVVWLTR